MDFLHNSEWMEVTAIGTAIVGWEAGLICRRLDKEGYVYRQARKGIGNVITTPAGRLPRDRYNDAQD